ncbi:hypothetical protein PEL8287_00387 [Roseovarius litorisediminis]|uniref:Inner membrane protein YjgN n=2 Tax=Roseovarius litorisediminis TaxID=1312363 RepID=A0A1Y5RE19_9RHOB|nr:hypothetical protein PEL8287_00387 [Roseovarius litorisediminis]
MGSGQISGQYVGKRGPLFGLAFTTALLTALTVGIYRFWGKTRIRRYIWSSVSGDGDAFEYTGTGVEKFLGFLVAMVVLAIYLGIIQTILFFFGLTLFTEAETMAQQAAQVLALNITFLAVVPLIFFAQYRARRYKLARTRWRGVRFGAEKAAWGYSWRAMLHGLVTLMSLGFLLPRQTFCLAKYKADRTWFGDAKFEQRGKWTGLYPAMKQLFFAGIILVLGAIVLAISGQGAVGQLVAGFFLLIIGFIWFMIGLVSYRVRSLDYLANHLVLEGQHGQVRFAASPMTGTVITTMIAGGLAASVLSGIALSLVALVTGAIWAVTGAIIGESAFQPGVTELVGLTAFAGLYIGALALSGGLILVLVTQPIIAHIVKTITVRNTGALAAIRQRASDRGADAEGFADALDVGGAF